MIPTEHSSIPNIVVEQSGSNEQRGKGYDEQWQRHMEKAYFEKQVTNMRSTGHVEGNKDVIAAESGSNNAANSLKSTADISNTIDGVSEPKQLLLPATTLAAVNNPSLFSIGGDKNALRISTSTPLVSPGQNQITQHNNVLLKNTAAPTSVSRPTLGGVLPQSSAVNSLITEQGTHLVIRDASLSKDQVLRLLSGLKELVETSNQRLWAITLNGERVWQNTEQLPRLSEQNLHEENRVSTEEPVVSSEQHINHIY